MTAGRGGNTAGGPARHVPVMLPDVLEALAPLGGGTYVDGTFGGGGYTSALLEAADCVVIAIDRDPAAISAGEAMVAAFAPRLSLIEGRFGEMLELLNERSVVKVDGVTLDVGVSSRQLGEAGRGFSFQSDGPLDMRMGSSGPTAADVVNRLSEADLARTIAVYGEERRARAVARAICAARRERPLTRTGELASVVARVTGGPRSRIHPATRTFQAIRILVNAELDELSSGLVAAERLLREGGRLAIVTFHSLEDRIVKRFLGARMGRGRSVSRHRPEVADGPQPSFRAVGALLRKPAGGEIESNPRARSARLRVAERTAAAPWPLSLAPLDVIPATPYLESLA